MRALFWEVENVFSKCAYWGLIKPRLLSIFHHFGKFVRCDKKFTFLFSKYLRFPAPVKPVGSSKLINKYKETQHSISINNISILHVWHEA